jgi:predicted kinase
MKNKLILLNGPAGIGKTTIARLYVEANPLSLRVEGDSIIGMIGDWRNNEEAARTLKFAHITSMIKTHLLTGHDVILPYLVTDSTHAKKFEALAAEFDADFIEIILSTDKETAVRRLLKRGVWGEEGSKQLNGEDVPRIERLYDLMIAESEKRKNMKILPFVEDDIDGTYLAFINLTTS